MEKTATLNLRINPDIKKSAEDVLSALGLTMTAAINIYLKQIALRGAIPFEIALPNAPPSINTDIMSPAKIKNNLEKGLSDIEKGNTADAVAFFNDFRRAHSND